MSRAVNQKNIDSAKKQRIGFLDDMRAVAIIMVIGVHSLGYCVPLPPDYREIIRFIVHTISVPVFFLVDGYLLGWKKIDLQDHAYYLAYIKKSAYRLLMPWVIFTLIYLGARYFFELIGFLNEKIILGQPLSKVILSAYGSVYAPQMYFLFSLFLIRVLAPIFSRLLLVRNYPYLFLFLLCYYFIYEFSISFISAHLKIEGGQEPILHAIWGTQFYLLGIACFKLSEVFKFEFFIPILLLFVFSLFMQDKIGHYGSVLRQYLYLLSFYMFFISIKIDSPILKTIGKKTMGIYLIHAPIVLKCVSIVSNKFIFNPLLSYASILICTFFLTLLIVIIIDFIPYGGLLFGAPYRKTAKSE